MSTLPFRPLNAPAPCHCRRCTFGIRARGKSCTSCFHVFLCLYKSCRCTCRCLNRRSFGKLDPSEECLPWNGSIVRPASTTPLSLPTLWQHFQMGAKVNSHTQLVASAKSPRKEASLLFNRNSRFFSRSWLLSLDRPISSSALARSISHLLWLSVFEETLGFEN